MPDDRIELTREELYKLVWSEPMRVIAPRYGLSDAGLAKICRRLKVPRPGRGYWQRLRVGKRDRRPPLRRLPAGARDRVIIDRTPVPAEVEETGPIADQRRFESQPENRIAVPERVGRYHPLVGQTRLALRAARSLGYRAARSPKGLAVDVSRASLRRALRIMDTLIKALEARGMSVKIEGEKRTTVVDVRGTAVQIAVEERYRTIWLPPTLEELERERKYGWAPTRRYEREPNGKLALRILACYPRNQRRTWADTERQRVENCLNAFVVALVVTAEAEKAAELERQEQERRWREAEQRREEERRRAAREKARVAELRRQVAAWQEVRHTREYLEALRSAVAESDHDDTTTVAQWITWVKGYLEGLDPVRALTAAGDDGSDESPLDPPDEPHPYWST
jgi:hypothetical protein